MSAIDGLIAEFCPDGVEYRKLGDLFETFTGKTPKKTDASMYGSEYPFYKPGDFEHGFTAFETDDMLSETGFAESRHVKPGSTLVTCIASLGKIAFAQKEGACNQQINVIPPTEDMNSRFVFHYCCSTWFQSVLWKKANHSNVPNLSLAGFNTIEIPVPPVEVQREVVRILDTFVALTDTLTEELDCRRQQYAYYRDRLLSRESLEVLDGKPVEMKRLDEISISIKAGGDVPDDTVKGQTEPTDTHPYPVFSNGSNDKALYGYCSKYSIEKESVTISARGSIGFHSVRKPYFTPVVRLITVTPDVETITSAYLDLALTQTSINGDKGGIPQLTIPKVKGIEIPVPSLETQRKVVDILDRFDALTTSLTDGIPAEIEARKAQYAYYRDRLLDFPRKSGDAS